MVMLASSAAYAWVDTAVGGPARRNNVIQLADFQPNGRMDSYATFLRFTADLAVYANNNRPRGKPSVSGYPGPALATHVPFDFDDAADPARALAEAAQCVRIWEERYGLYPGAIRAYFSGQKGIALEVPASLFGGFLPSSDIARHLRRLAAAMLDEIGTASADLSIYQKLALWRVPNTRHSGTGLFKVPLTMPELLSGDMDTIRGLARAPRDLIFPTEDDWLPVPDLIDLSRQVSELRPTRIAPRPDGIVSDRTNSARPFDMEWALGGVKELQRDKAIFFLACSLRGRGTPRDVTDDLALFAAKRCAPPLTPEEALKIVEWVYSRYPTNAARLGRMNGAERDRRISPERLRIINMLCISDRPLGPKAIAQTLGKSTASIQMALIRMASAKLVTRVADGYIPKVGGEAPEL
jgi:primase-like protein